MLSSKEKVMMKYSVVVVTKLALGLLATLLAIAAAGLFALQADDREHNGFEISRGPGFYIQVSLGFIALFPKSLNNTANNANPITNQLKILTDRPMKMILLIVLTVILFVMSIYDVLFSRRDGGDPTRVAAPLEGATIGNPGFRERTNGRSVSVTDASGKPYVPTASNGSMASMNTTSTTIGSTNGSTVGSSSVTRSPLRSSLKKPKPKDGLGIQNPGFSGTSPTLSRNGSTKKVRIQTHSTEV
ncbi:hypothetical protein GEV33_001971 [Tenebrio molitor]|uniref:Uncharacterized protein n=1 Tax=Tenebrio molitor TaxID=7067 RepID=A0A8J6HUB9_TENMO|nr:hypothetical protein GEV33_001971 [Tenebrio molitor]